MKRIFIVPNPKKDKDYAITKKVANFLKEYGAEVFISNEYEDSDISFVKYRDSNIMDIELVIVIGGDGSFIDATSYAIDSDVPILGVNLGKVGYLNEVEESDLSVLKGIFENTYKIEEKILLSFTYTKNGQTAVCKRLAVNDVVISHSSYLGIADFVVYSKDGGIRYRADGVVFSTPQGSTAYSLSAGGPVVSHDANAVIVTPIAPHSFFNRSIVFSESEEIKLKNTSSEPLNISIDGRYYDKILSNEKCLVRAAEKKLKVLTFKDNNMFSNLFSKMQILEDII